MTLMTSAGVHNRSSLVSFCQERLLGWQPLLDEDSTIFSVLICLCDVSTLIYSVLCLVFMSQTQCLMYKPYSPIVLYPWHTYIYLPWYMVSCIHGSLAYIHILTLIHGVLYLCLSRTMTYVHTLLSYCLVSMSLRHSVLCTYLTLRIPAALANQIQPQRHVTRYHKHWNSSCGQKMSVLLLQG